METLELHQDRPKPEVETWAIDFETYFDKDCSVRKLGNLAYFNHPAFDPYLVTAHNSEGGSVCCHPDDFDWTMLDGKRVISHNASFDETLYQWGRDNGRWANCEPLEWMCSADMCAALNLPRNLGGAISKTYGVGMDKSVRDRMSGKRFENLPDDKREEFINYARMDARTCLYLWLDLSDQWSEFEREVSLVNRGVCRRGIAIDTEALDQALANLRKILFDAENAIPWNGEAPLLSRKAFNEECRKVGIEPPASLAKDNEQANDFREKYGDKYPWVIAVRDWRQINAMLQKLEAFDRSIMPNGRYYGGIFYFGAHTGRFSGSGGNLNLQNLHRGEKFGVTIRNLLKADKGKKLVVADLSQIEVRTLCWLAEDKEMLDEIAKADDIYETFAVRFGRWELGDVPLKEANPQLRHDVKQTVLGCGYQASGARYAAMENLPIEEGEKAVATYRDKMPKVVQYWHNLKAGLGVCADQKLDYEIDLPSGRTLRYGKVLRLKDDTHGPSQAPRFKYFVKIMKQGRPSNESLFGGKLAENASQALARDIFCDIMLRVEKRGLGVILHVHDELVVEVDEDKAEDALATMLEEMSKPPDWIPDIPLAAEGKILDVYEK